VSQCDFCSSHAPAWWRLLPRFGDDLVELRVGNRSRTAGAQLVQESLQPVDSKASPHLQTAAPVLRRREAAARFGHFMLKQLTPMRLRRSTVVPLSTTRSYSASPNEAVGRE
jgi:hypothetical protein